MRSSQGWGLHQCGSSACSGSSARGRPEVNIPLLWDACGFGGEREKAGNAGNSSGLTQDILSDCHLVSIIVHRVHGVPSSSEILGFPQ